MSRHKPQIFSSVNLCVEIEDGKWLFLNLFRIIYAPHYSLEYSLEGLMLKLKLQYFGHLMQRNDLLEKTVAGKY